MSSRFPDFFVPPRTSNVRTWMVQVNTNGDAVVYRLDGDSRPTDMACGPMVDTILQSLACALPNVVVHVLGNADDPRHYGFNVDTWADLVDVLTGRLKVSCRAETRRLWDYQRRAQFTPLLRYVVQHGYQYSDIRVTKEGRTADARFLAKQDEYRRRESQQLVDVEVEYAPGADDTRPA